MCICFDKLAPRWLQTVVYKRVHRVSPGVWVSDIIGFVYREGEVYELGEHAVTLHFSDRLSGEGFYVYRTKGIADAKGDANMVTIQLRVNPKDYIGCNSHREVGVYRRVQVVGEVKA